MSSFYASFQDFVRDIILVFDADTGEIVEANHAAEVAYLYSRDELLKLTVFDLRPDSSHAVLDQMKTADNAGLLFETAHRRRDGTMFPVEVSSRGETIADKRFLLSIIRDITDRKRLEQERERLLVATQEALHIREEFLWVASHELRTPLAVMSLQLQQLRRLIDRGETEARLRPEIVTALKQVDRLDGLIEGLLDASRVARGKLVLELDEVDLAQLVATVVERLDGARGQVTVNVPPIHGRWDRVRVDRMLTSLVTNALKYGPGQPVQIVATEHDDRVTIEVHDEGIGLSAGDLERIFEKFERAVPSAHYGGLGLGLFIARQIVEAHGGQIEVESTPGAGATFRVTLPRVAV